MTAIPRRRDSKKQVNQLIKDLVCDVEDHIAEKLLPALRAAIVEQLGVPSQGQWSLEIDTTDAQTVNFHYPTALHAPEYEGMAYITPRVKLELGARGDPWPTEQRVIRPYAAEDYPSFFDDSTCTVAVLSARRTFWACGGTPSHGVADTTVFVAALLRPRHAF